MRDQLQTPRKISSASRSPEIICTTRPHWRRTASRKSSRFVASRAALVVMAVMSAAPRARASATKCAIASTVREMACGREPLRFVDAFTETRGRVFGGERRDLAVAHLGHKQLDRVCSDINDSAAHGERTPRL